MKQLQGNLTIEILFEGTANLKAEVLRRLAQKRKFIDDKYNDPSIPEQLLPKLKEEEEFINAIKAYMKNQEDVINELKMQLLKSDSVRLKQLEINDMLRSEVTDYMNKYYDLVWKK